jgi:hypothetical protein
VDVQIDADEKPYGMQEPLIQMMTA